VEKARVLATGVELMLAEEVDLGPPFEIGRPTPEERAERQRVDRGEMVEVALQPFAEFEVGGEIARWGGSQRGTRPIDLTTDPTSALLGIAAEGRDEEAELLGDLHIAELDVARFAFHAAPHRIELSAALRERIEAAGWKL
jgi:hypothetical protein